MKVGKKMLLMLGLLLVTVYSSFAEVKPIIGEVMADGNQIRWAVESTKDVNFFIVQRSKDGVKFFPLAIVAKVGDKFDYTYMDEKVESESWFYRIVDVDYQGVGELSSALFLENTYGVADVESVKPPTNIIINDHIASEMNCWLNELEFPTISKLGMVANYSHVPMDEKICNKK